MGTGPAGAAGVDSSDRHRAGAQRGAICGRLPRVDRSGGREDNVGRVSGRRGRLLSRRHGRRRPIHADGELPARRDRRTVALRRPSRRAAVRAGLAAIGAERSTVWLASTDADRVVPDTWLERQARHASRGRAAVAGIVELDPLATPAGRGPRAVVSPACCRRRRPSTNRCRRDDERSHRRPSGWRLRQRARSAGTQRRAEAGGVVIRTTLNCVRRAACGRVRCRNWSRVSS